MQINDARQRYAAWAPIYDNLVDEAGTKDAVALLAELFTGRSLLDVGSGTGRLTIPLAQAGILVRGVDVSPEMTAVLGTRVAALGLAPPAVTVADYGSWRTEERFDGILFAFNALLEAADAGVQQQWLSNATLQLAPAGLVVIETWVPPAAPDLGLPPFEVVAAGDDRYFLKVNHHEAGRQVLLSWYLDLTDTAPAVLPVRARYTGTAELDAMASSAGLVLLHRYAGWRRQPFVPGSSQWQVAIYRSTVR